MTLRTISPVLQGVGWLFVFLAVGGSFAQENQGFRYNNLTISPYVNLEYTYDSNVDYDKADNADSMITISPGVDLSYRGNEWGLSGQAWYGHDYYCTFDELEADRYGESLEFYRESAKGWRLVMRQSYLRSSQNDSIIDGGRGIWRDREVFTWGGALSYQLSERTGVTLSGMYSDLSYVRDNNQYQPLYGNTEWSAGLEFARKISEKSNLLLSGSYGQYTSDGATLVSDQSTMYSLMAGFGSRATRRITYRALTGLQWFDYGDDDLITGWTYSLGANWMISRKWALSVAGSSNYQPSEHQANQAMQVYSLSSGVTYRPWDRLTARFDVAYRREENEYNVGGVSRSTDDEVSTRLRVDYRLRRFVTLYGGVEYEKQFSDDDLSEFDRYRALLGVSLRY